MSGASACEQPLARRTPIACSRGPRSAGSAVASSAAPGLGNVGVVSGSLVLALPCCRGPANAHAYDRRRSGGSAGERSAPSHSWLSTRLEAPLERVQVRADLLRRAPPRQRGVERADAVTLELDLERHAGGGAARLREGHRLARPQRPRQRAEAPARAGLVVGVLRADLGGGDAGDGAQFAEEGAAP